MVHVIPEPTPRSRSVGDPQQDIARLQASHDRLRIENSDLRRENAELRRHNRWLQTAVDAHIRRAQNSGLFGPIEMTAGTGVGPRRRRPSE